MAFQLSPSVLVTETDLTNIVPAVATSTGAFAGSFSWGPVLVPTILSSEADLTRLFGTPQIDNATSFFTAANFLSYSNNLLLVRCDTTLQRNAVAKQSGSVKSITITNGGSDYTSDSIVEIGAPDEVGGVQATGHIVLGDNGTIDHIVIDQIGSGYTVPPSVVIHSDKGINFVANVSIEVGGIKILNEDDYLNHYANGNGMVGSFAAKYPGAIGNSLRIEIADASTFANWAYNNEFNSAPGTSTYVEQLGGANDELHVIIIDEGGLWTGIRGTILEKFAYLSKASDAKLPDGVNNYYKNVINTQSRYLWWMDHPENVSTSGVKWGTSALNHIYKSLTNVYSASLSGGATDLKATDGQLIQAWSLFSNAELYDISLMPTGHVSATVAAYIIQNIAEVRRDCMVFVSPVTDTGEMIQGLDAVNKTIEFRAKPPFDVSSSYAFLDSGWKYQYDRYFDVYRWVPLNGDIAGICARTDYTNAPWWSPGGYTRGQIKNVVKLSLNPNQTERDYLYKNGINPVVAFLGQGTILYGDKTLLAKPSAFDRINVRRLFIVLEKAIATAAKYQLFEFNDMFTRSQFVGMIEPFLRDVQGRRGIVDFKVVCDESNNTPDVIDRNEFVANISIKPNRSINFITLNFIAVRSGASFTEIGV